MDWTPSEVEAIVADYLQMLTLELLGQKFNKTEHLQLKLQDRSEGSIEFKHGNISAALIDLGLPYLQGYKPRSNYQTLVGEVLVQQVKGKLVLDQAALAVVQTPAVMPTEADFSKVKTEAPKKSNEVKETRPLFPAFARTISCP